jgi:predicted SnoaL-like aldol condensation-catalyzing enzyme
MKKILTARRMRFFLILLLAMNSISSICFGMSDIDKALTMFQGIGERDAVLATRYIDPLKFKNHNPMAYDGIEGIKGFISHLPKEKSPLTVLRAFQDGKYVFTQAEGDLFGKKVFFDIFKFEDGKIVEHWDNLADFTPPNQSGHTPTDGATKAVDLEKTEQNKELIKGFYSDIFLNGQFQKMGGYFNGDNFIRHDARGGDGLTALSALMQEQAKKGIVMKVDKINMILGQGNFVLVAATGSIADKPVVYYDLFRVEKDKIAEHWDVIENIPPADQWRNQNGKF